MDLLIKWFFNYCLWVVTGKSKYQCHSVKPTRPLFKTGFDWRDDDPTMEGWRCRRAKGHIGEHDDGE